MPDIIPSINQLRREFQIPSAVTILEGRSLRIQRNTVYQNGQNFDTPPSTQEDKGLDYSSTLGTKVYTNIEFLPGKYETNVLGVFKEFGSSVDGPERLRYEAVLITVQQEKKIVTTEIAGRDGKIKEYIGLDDYNVTVNGIITGTNGQRPVDQIIALKKMLDAPISIHVASSYLQMLDINFLVLSSYELDEQEGGYSYQRFAMNFISDIEQEVDFGTP